LAAGMRWPFLVALAFPVTSDSSSLCDRSDKLLLIVRRVLRRGPKRKGSARVHSRLPPLPLRC
jgi:hypothetical protein